MAKLITISGNELRLCSNLDEYSFGKTNYESIITQTGLIYSDKNFSLWSFSDVKSYNIEENDQRIVFYCAENPFSANTYTLLELFEKAEKNESKKDYDILFCAVKLVCKALTDAALTGREIPMIGAGGILVEIPENLNEEDGKVLFLPEGLFTTSANSLSTPDYAQNHLSWINQTIYDLPAICFERAVIVYRFLTQKFPYTCENQVERNADILDSKFLPLQMCIKNIDKDFAQAVNNALKLNSNSVNIPGKKQKGKTSEDLTPTADFPLELLQNAYNLSFEQRKNPPENDFFERAETYQKTQDSKIKAKRRIRRNSAVIIVGLVVGVILATLIANSVQTSRNSETSIGLSSTETVLGYFYGVNSKDTVLLTNLVNGRKPQKHVDTVSQIYVLDKQRHIYENDNGFATPENWLLFSTTMERYANSGVYGVTNLKIDGEPVEIQISLPKKKDKPVPIQTENNLPVENKMQTVRHAEYYLIHSEGENNQFIVEKVFEDFTLTFHKNKWLITGISTESVTVPVSSITFKNDYFNQLAVTGKNVIAAVENLREKYPWLPTKEALENEDKRLQAQAEDIFSAFQY